MRNGITSHLKFGALGLAVLAVAVTVWWPFGEDELSRMTLERRAGEVQVLRGDKTMEVTDRLALKPGDKIRVSADGAAGLQLETGRRARLGASTLATVVDTTTLEASMGKLLAETESPMNVRFGSVAATTSGAAFRVDLGAASTRVASYAGSVKLAVPGQPRLRLKTLYQATVAANALPDKRSPYQLDPSDEWDREVLDYVVELDESLARLAASFSSQDVGKERPSTDYFATLAGNRDAAFMKPYLNRRIPTSDLLVGFTIANADDANLKNAVRKAFGLYEDGARWGVTAAIMLRERKLDGLVAQVKGLFLATDVVAGGAGGDADFTLAGAAEVGTGGETTDPGDPGDDPGNDDPGNDDPGNDDPDPKPSPEDCEDLADCGTQEIEDEVDKIVPTPSPSPPPIDAPPILP